MCERVGNLGGKGEGEDLEAGADLVSVGGVFDLSRLNFMRSDLFPYTEFCNLREMKYRPSLRV